MKGRTEGQSLTNWQTPISLFVGDKKNIEAGLDRPSDDNYDVRMYRPAATHYLAGCKIDLNHYRPFETMNQTLNPYLPYNEFYLRPGFDPVAWHRTIRDLHYEINPDSELSDPEVRKLFTLQDSENYGGERCWNWKLKVGDGLEME